MGRVVDFFIDLGGRSRKVGQRNVPIAVSKVGYIYLRTVERPFGQQNSKGRTVIITFAPRLVSELAIAALGYKLADLEPERTVVVAEGPRPRCRVFADAISALRLVGALAGGTDNAWSTNNAEEHFA
jgi:hypothetical protein